MRSAELEKMINEIKLILCRSGCTSIMDLAKLGKKAFLIPTLRKFEQEFKPKSFKNTWLFLFVIKPILQ